MERTAIDSSYEHDYGIPMAWTSAPTEMSNAWLENNDPPNGEHPSITIHRLCRSLLANARRAFGCARRVHAPRAVCERRIVENGAAATFSRANASSSPTMS